MTSISRREFVAATAAGLAASPLAAARAFAQSSPEIHVGCAAITWGGDDRQAIADIADAGYSGIQLRSTVVARYANDPAALGNELKAHRLTFVALSSGNLRIDPAVESEELATHTRHASFVRDAGGLYLQVIDERPKGRDVTPADCARLGRLMTELGRRIADAGIPLAYHHHMNSIGESPDAIARILEAADPRYVKLLLDIAHYQQGGGDPVAAVRCYADRLIFLHIKDVERITPGSPDLPVQPGIRPYRFVELGRGRVDVKGVFAALRDVKFRGWVVVELDAVPDTARTPKESALINKKYLEEQIGLRVG